MSDKFKEVSAREFATLIGCSHLVAGHCISVTAQGGVKASYHDREVADWPAFSHCLPGGHTRYFVAVDAIEASDEFMGRWQDAFEQTVH